MRELEKHRDRMRVGLAVLIVVTAGVVSRMGGGRFPRWIAKDLGDVLWGVMFYLLVVWVWNRVAYWRAAVCALLVVWVIEFLKLYHGEWVETVRGTSLGGYLLGRYFDWWNLLSCGMGVIVALVLDCVRILDPGGKRAVV